MVVSQGLMVEDHVNRGSTWAMPKPELKMWRDADDDGDSSTFLWHTADDGGGGAHTPHVMPDLLQQLLDDGDHSHGQGHVHASAPSSVNVHCGHSNGTSNLKNKYAAERAKGIKHGGGRYG